MKYFRWVCMERYKGHFFKEKAGGMILQKKI
jgi:hypothetical protein